MWQTRQTRSKRIELAVLKDRPGLADETDTDKEVDRQKQTAREDREQASTDGQLTDSKDGKDMQTQSE